MEKILVIGACGQIGCELTLALRAKWGTANVIAADVQPEHSLLYHTGPFIHLDIMDKENLKGVVRLHGITQIYLMAAMLSATGEKYPRRAWDLNMDGLLNTLEIATEEKVSKVFWPSSIAVFGPSAPKHNCPQHALQQPATIYGISKMAGEQLCAWYHQHYQLDIRSIRYPGLISYRTAPGGGTTDYAVDIFHQAIEKNSYCCYLQPDTRLPMMYMPDAIRATMELMDAPAEKISIRTSYNLSGCSFTPGEIAEAIHHHRKDFSIWYAPDYRQQIAVSWPQSIEDVVATKDWNWWSAYDLKEIVRDMLEKLAGTAVAI